MFKELGALIRLVFFVVVLSFFLVIFFIKLILSHFNSRCFMPSLVGGALGF